MPQSCVILFKKISFAYYVKENRVKYVISLHFKWKAIHFQKESIILEILRITFSYF